MSEVLPLFKATDKVGGSLLHKTIATMATLDTKGNEVKIYQGPDQGPAAEALCGFFKDREELDRMIDKPLGNNLQDEREESGQ